MNTRLTSLLALLAIILVGGCTTDTGNPDLSGTWSCQETSQIYLKSTKGTSIYQVTLSRDASNTNKYYIDNFYKLGNGIKVAVIKDGYSISLPKQSVDGFLFEGSGTVNESYDLINLTYTADDGGGQVDHVTADYSR
jgi:outer membrane biogenesis lipoprotein LolB